MPLVPFCSIFVSFLFQGPWFLLVYISLHLALTSNSSSLSDISLFLLANLLTFHVWYSSIAWDHFQFLCVLLCFCYSCRFSRTPFFSFFFLLFSLALAKDECVVQVAVQNFKEEMRDGGYSLPFRASTWHSFLQLRSLDTSPSLGKLLATQIQSIILKMFIHFYTLVSVRVSVHDNMPWDCMCLITTRHAKFFLRCATSLAIGT